MKNKIILSLIVFSIGIFFVKNNFQIIENQTIAACPTFHYLLDNLANEEKITVKKTLSTFDNIKLKEQGVIDFFISGRALKPQENGLLFEKIGDGYDFIFQQEFSLLEKEMNLFTFYTDLSVENIIKDFKYISENNIIKVENIKNYLDKGIIITSLEDTLVGESVHILKENGQRVRLSRLPRLYYSSSVTNKELNFIKKSLYEN